MDVPFAASDWFLTAENYRARFHLLPLLRAVHRKRAAGQLKKAWASADRSLKHSILVAASEMRQPELFRLGVHDPDPYVRELAEMFLGSRDSRDWTRRWHAALSGI